MLFAPHRSFVLGVRATMLLAIAAFMVQAVLVWNSQAAAAMGVMPEPSVTISGSLHYHNDLAGNVHEHSGDNSDGHVHHSTHDDHGSDHADRDGCVSICSLFAASISPVSMPGPLTPVGAVNSLDTRPANWLSGIDPAALTKPPSTSSIA